MRSQPAHRLDVELPRPPANGRSHPASSSAATGQVGVPVTTTPTTLAVAWSLLPLACIVPNAEMGTGVPRLRLVALRHQHVADLVVRHRQIALPPGVAGAGVASRSRMARLSR